MRDIFVRQATNYLTTHPLSILLTADLGFAVFDDLIENCPNQFLNVGISEQLMSSFAAGFALSGNKVITYSIGVFPTLRCLEQIRNDICYHDSNVMIVSTGAGFTYGQLGITHHCTEDIGFCSSIPNLLIASPANSHEASSCIDQLLQSNKPSYLRLDKLTTELLESFPISKIDNTYIYHAGSNPSVLIVTHGTSLDITLQLVNSELSDQITVASVPLLSSDNEELARLIEEHNYIITVEEHNRSNGFGSWLSSFMRNKHLFARIYSFGLDTLISTVGEQGYLRSLYLPTPQQLLEFVKTECLN